MAKFTTIADFTRRLRIPDRSPDNTLMTPMQAKTDILSGLTVALALVPEAVAFAFVAGVEPLVGLYVPGRQRALCSAHATFCRQISPSRWP